MHKWMVKKVGVFVTGCKNGLVIKKSFLKNMRLSLHIQYRSQSIQSNTLQMETIIFINNISPDLV